MICGIPVARIDDPRGLPVEEQLSILVRLAWLEDRTHLMKVIALTRKI